jgi:hypothetical protein
MRYFKTTRFIKLQQVSEKDLKDVPSDWIEVQKNGEPLEEKVKPLEEKKKSKSKK